MRALDLYNFSKDLEFHLPVQMRYERSPGDLVDIKIVQCEHIGDRVIIFFKETNFEKDQEPIGKIPRKLKTPEDYS